jgi:hypothetical protein
MADAKVTCVSKTGSDHSTITHLGGPSGWRWTKAEVITSIEAGTNTFFTIGPDGKRANILVVDENPKYVRTVADGKWTNNLLALPSCPEPKKSG